MPCKIPNLCLPFNFYTIYTNLFILFVSIFFPTVTNPFRPKANIKQTKNKPHCKLQTIIYFLSYLFCGGFCKFSMICSSKTALWFNDGMDTKQKKKNKNTFTHKFHGWKAPYVSMEHFLAQTELLRAIEIEWIANNLFISKGCFSFFFFFYLVNSTSAFTAVYNIWFVSRLSLALKQFHWFELVVLFFF